MNHSCADVAPKKSLKLNSDCLKKKSYFIDCAFQHFLNYHFGRTLANAEKSYTVTILFKQYVCMGFLQVHQFPVTTLIGGLVPLGMNEYVIVYVHSALPHAQCSMDRVFG